MTQVSTAGQTRRTAPNEGANRSFTRSATLSFTRHAARTLVAIATSILICGALGCVNDAGGGRLDTGSPASLIAVHSISQQLDDITAGFEAMANRAPWRERGYFDSADQDAIEALFFQFSAARDALLGLGASIPLQKASDRGLTSLTHYVAALALIDYDGRLVEAFDADPVAKAKLDEAFYRSEIPAGTYSKLRVEVTDSVRIESIIAGLASYEDEFSDPESPITLALAADALLADMVSDADARRDEINARLDRLAGHRMRVLSSAEVLLAHTRLGDEDRAAKRDFHAGMTKSRALLFKNVSRIKNPSTKLIRFDDSQRQAIREVLEPGDILFTYTAGYVSDVFIPGAFKHALVWVGTPGERKDVGLVPDALGDLPAGEADRVEAHFDLAEVPEGGSADLIEAIAEGVKFSHLDTILDTHVNRFLVLRPQIDSAERVAALIEVFRYLGDAYDFRFDFGDASKQVCTEVVYRAFNGRGEIRYALTERAGNPTLSADDIINAALGSEAAAYEVIVFADVDPDGEDQAARVLVRQSATDALVELMNSTNKKSKKMPKSG
jgi:hypothetical protein